MSRHKHRPTDEQRHQVLTLAGFGIPQTEIATLLRLAPKTLRLRYRHELDTGVTAANVRVAQSLFNMAVRDRIPAAAIFWLKCRANWREPPRDLNLGGQADNPLSIDFSWAPALPVATANPSAPTIDGEAAPTAPTAGQLVVEWEAESC